MRWPDDAVPCWQWTGDIGSMKWFHFLLGRLWCLLHRHRLYIPVIRTGSSTQTFLDGYLTSSILCIPCQIWCVTIEVLHNLPPTLQLCSEGAIRNPAMITHDYNIPYDTVDIFFVLASSARASSWLLALLAPWAVFCTIWEYLRCICATQKVAFCTGTIGFVNCILYQRCPRHSALDGVEELALSSVNDKKQKDNIK